MSKLDSTIFYINFNMETNLRTCYSPVISWAAIMAALPDKKKKRSDLDTGMSHVCMASCLVNVDVSSPEVRGLLRILHQDMIMICAGLDASVYRRHIQNMCYKILILYSAVF